MAAATAAALPAVLLAGASTASLGGCDSRTPSRRYRKYELIGQGAQKKVYRAFDEERGIEVAWNEVAVAELARFRQKDQQRVFAEIRVLKQLKHKNIMTLHDYWFDERRLTLVFTTEIFPDGTLRQYRRRHKHADLPAIKRWAWQILQGLVYLHGHNPPIIHRDLKCDNIFVCGSSGIVKIGDLGLVTLCRDLTAPQSVLGTPEFMAPELYEEKYDEKVDVYAFGMCLLELTTMEYPYCECKNAAQIYKKVTQGIPPASVEKLASTELRDFVMLCLSHDPSRRPEARQLLKHPFFEAIRAAPSHMGSCGTPPKMTVVTSMAMPPSVEPSRPVTFVDSLSADAATLAAAAAAAAAAAGDGDGMSPTALSHAASYDSPGQATASDGCGSSGGSARAAAAREGAVAVAAATSPLLSVRSSSVEMQPPYPQLQVSTGPMAASLSPHAPSPIVAAVNGTYGSCSGPNGSGTGIGAAAMAAPVPMLVATQPAMGGTAGCIAGSIAAAAATAAGSHSPSILGGGAMGVPLLGVGGPGSIASSLSPAARPGMLSSALDAAVDGSATSTPGSAFLGLAAASPLGGGSNVGSGGGGSPTLPYQSCIGDAVARRSGSAQGSSLVSALTAELHSCQPQGCANVPVPGVRLTAADCVAAAAAASVAAAGDADVSGRNGVAVGTGASCATRAMTDGRSQQQLGGPYAGVSPSAAAIAAAAVSAAAAAVGASSGPMLSSPLGLPAIHEDHELHDDMIFEQEDFGDRSGCCGGNVDGGSEEDEDGGDEDEEDCGSGGHSPGSPAGPAPGVVGGCRSQPVSLQVRSSGQAAMTNMALSFAMSFTNQRGVRKKVGFQYDLLHDTASAIAVEMVENLSLDTAEAEAIAAMIQHEVSRFNMQQEQQQQQELQQRQQQVQQQNEYKA